MRTEIITPSVLPEQRKLAYFTDSLSSIKNLGTVIDYSNKVYRSARAYSTDVFSAINKSLVFEGIKKHIFVKVPPISIDCKKDITCKQRQTIFNGLG
jgi:hypothetical protein